MVRARAGQGPSLIEGRTYRYFDHSLGLGRIVRATYRPEEEVEQWKQRDPITLFQQRLRAEGSLTDVDLDNMETAIAAEIAEAVSFAESGSWEPLEDLTKDVYTPTKPSG